MIEIARRAEAEQFATLQLEGMHARKPQLTCAESQANQDQKRSCGLHLAFGVDWPTLNRREETRAEEHRRADNCCNKSTEVQEDTGNW
jgi:hypothetical protein